MKKEELAQFLNSPTQQVLTEHLSLFSEEEKKTLTRKWAQSFEKSYFISELPKETSFAPEEITPLSSCYLDTPLVFSPSLLTSLHVVILAAGQGTRLGYDKPKALLPFHQASLLGHHFASLKHFPFSSHISIHLLLSAETGAQIIEHLKNESFFGWDEKKIHFHYQKDAFFLNERLELQLSSIDQLARGPAGNGEVFKAISPLLFKEEDLIAILPIDNPLGSKALPFLVTEMKKPDIDLALAVFPKNDPTESLGVVMQYHGYPVLIDYPFLPELLRKSDQPLWANTNLFMFRGHFFHKVSGIDLPFHTIVKKVPIYPGKVETLYRFERFITDAVSFAHNPRFITFDRETLYCAIKDRASYQKALSLNLF